MNGAITNKPENGCDGCRFTRGAKRCETCSRRYADRFEPPPPPKPMSRNAAMALATILAATTLTDDAYTRGAGDL